MSAATCSEHLTEEQAELLKSLEEEFKDRYTENDEGFKATLKETTPLPPIVENWRDFSRPDRKRSRSGNPYRESYLKRHRYEDGNSDRYPDYSRYDYRYGARNHPMRMRWD